MADKNPAAKKSVAKPAASQEVNKSAEIRKVATSMKAEGKKPRPVVIIETLKKKGVTVSSPQVSMVLKRMGFRPRKRRKAAAAASSSVSGAAKKGASRAGKVSVEDLIAAKKIASSFGGTDRAIAALSALKRFEG